MNVYEAALSEAGDELRLGSQSLLLPASISGDPAVAPYRAKTLVVGIRPEDLADVSQRDGASGGQRLSAEVELIEELGSEKLIHFRIDARRVRAETDAPVAGEDIEVLGQGEIGAAATTSGVARAAPKSKIQPGDTASFAVDVERLYLFDEDSGVAIRGPEG